MSRHTAHVSRTGLALVGLILLLAGGAALARGLGASAAILGDSHTSLLTLAQTRYPAQHGWAWWAVAAAGAVIALLALWWMAAQTSTRTVRRLSVEPDRRHGTTVLRASAVTDAIADELESYTGIRAAGAALRGSAASPSLRLSVTAENRADHAAFRTRVQAEALAHLRTALELDTVPTMLHIQFSRAFNRHLALPGAHGASVMAVMGRHTGRAAG